MAKKKTTINKSDICLILVFTTLLIFTIYMCNLYERVGSIPEFLVGCVYGVLGSECGALAWIKTNKDRHQEREWQKEDEKKAKRRN